MSLTPGETNLTLLDAVRQQGYRGRVALTARIPSDAERLTRAGADLILCPHLDAANRAVERLLPVKAGCGTVDASDKGSGTGTLFSHLR